MRLDMLRPAPAFLFLTLLCLATQATAQGIEDSYHARLGHGTGTGMLEKWCALPNFSFSQQGGIDGWIQQGCGECHVGAGWNPDSTFPDCFLCHNGEGFTVTDSGCLHCHVRDASRRGDRFTDEADAHIAAGLTCTDCHRRYQDKHSDHQFLKGTAIDTTEPTLEGSLSCTRFCHSAEPHRGGPEGDKLNQHTDKVACETCHIGARPAQALASRSWNVFDDEGDPRTAWRDSGWMPEYKWYDNSGPGPAGAYDLPILDHDERRDVAGARIYPFNAVTVEWFVKQPDAALHDVIIVADVMAADADGDGTTTVEEMRAVRPGATLVTADMNFSVSHGVMPKEKSFDCHDCHGRGGWLLDWAALGYSFDPGGERERERNRGKD